MAELRRILADPSFKNLSNEIASGNCVVFIGAGVSVAAGLPSWADLEAAMREKAGLRSSHSAPRIADCCRAAVGEQNFNKLIRSQVGIEARPTEAHRRLAGLPVTVFVTTNYDTLLEDALQSIKRPFKVLSLFESAEWLQIGDPVDECLVLKIHGCISRSPNRLVVTEDDYLRFSDEHPTIIHGLSGILARRPIFFIGYSLSDWHLLSILHQVTAMTAGNSTNKYYLGVNLEPSLRRFLEQRHRLFVMNVEATTAQEAVLSFLDALTDEFEVPTWLRSILSELGKQNRAKDLSRATPLEPLFPAFDVVTHMRLALKIENQQNVQLPMDRVMRTRTIGEMMDLLQECQASGSADD